MDGQPVTGEPSIFDYSLVDGFEPPPDFKEEIPKTFTEIFMKVFPQFMAIGMSYDEFWRGPAFLTQAYRDAYELKMRAGEWERWRQGMYNYNAFMALAPVIRNVLSKSPVKPGDYPDKPWPISDKEAEERKIAERRDKFNKMLARMTAEAKLNKEKLEAQKREEAKADG